MWIQLENIDTAKKQGTSELRGTLELIQTDPPAAEWGTWDLEGLKSLSRSCSQFFPPRIEIQAFYTMSSLPMFVFQLEETFLMQVEYLKTYLH